MVQALKKKLKNEKGFTLIELLAVIVILGIIAAIAIPSITHIIQKSKDDAVHAEALQVLDAAKNYVASNNITATTTFTNGGALDNYLDNPGTYSITLTYSNSAVTYSAIKVIKNGITKYYVDEDALNSNTSTAPPAS